MPVVSARKMLESCSRAALMHGGTRFALRIAGAALLIALGSHGLQTAAANGDTRTLSFHHLHTGETITITFKRDGRYDDAALKKLDWFMRDWRRNEAIEMDPQLYDLLWEAYRAVDGRQPIQVVCGYRAPETNAMLRRVSSGVAKASQHTQGHAMDFFIPGVSLEALRNVGLRLQRGGVGFYPSSGSPFVHMDTGSVRHWPRLSHEQLVRIFPDGRTVHVGSDGQPLKNYALALADIERRGGQVSTVALAARGGAGASRTASETMDNDGRTVSRGGNLLARLFGGGDEEAADAAPTPAPRGPQLAAVRAAPPPTPVATTRIAAPEPVETTAAIPLPQARPAAVLAALLPLPKPAPARGVQTASADPAVTAGIVAEAGIDRPADKSALSAMAYAATEPPAALAISSQAMPSRATPMPRAMPVATMPAAGEPAAALAGGRPQEPWLRAVLLTPSVHHYLTAMATSRLDPRPLAGAMHKPRMTLTATFSADPQAGLRSDRFAGEAVVFLATATFGNSRTAALMR